MVTKLYSAIKWDSLIKLIMFRAATLSKRSFIEEAVKCLLRVASSASQCRTLNHTVKYAERPDASMDAWTRPCVPHDVIL